MRIEIKVDADNNPDQETIILSDESLNNDNFVDLIVGDKESYTVPFGELESAVLAFRYIREHNRTA